MARIYKVVHTGYGKALIAATTRPIPVLSMIDVDLAEHLCRLLNAEPLPRDGDAAPWIERRLLEAELPSAQGEAAGQ